MRYEIVQDESPWELEEKVQKMLDTGWESQGGVATREVGYSTRYLQAMVRKD